jgi:hypothetical protein
MDTYVPGRPGVSVALLISGMLLGATLMVFKHH